MKCILHVDIFQESRKLRTVFQEYRESTDSSEKSDFFLFCQNIPLDECI